MTTLVARPAPRRVNGERQQLVAVAHLRLMVLTLLFAAGMTTIIGRLLWLGIASPPTEGASAGAALPSRGDIVDRNGVPLARTIDAWSIGVHPARLIGDRRVLAGKLAELLPERSETELFQLLTSRRKFEYLRRRAMPELVAQVNALGDPGIAYAREPERLYPQATVAAHVLGFTDFDGNGMSGMEAVLDSRLKNQVLRGRPAELAIDSRVQAAMESELYGAMVKHSAQGAAGLVLDVDTGEVVALASLPVFDPNKPGNIPAKQVDANGRDIPGPGYNRVTRAVYELGSAFKPIAVATAIDSGVVTSMSRRFDATGPMKVGRFTISDSHSQRRYLNIPETLIHSSNVSTARIADEVGRARIETVFRKLGFDSPPDIELRSKGTPQWPKYWARTTTMTVAYGHGIAVTPLHLASAYAAMVNGGLWRPATLMKVAPGKAAAGRRVFSESTSARMRQLLRLIVTHGTGKKGEAAGFRVGGKTGTAEKADGGGYSSTKNVSTFAAAFPMDRPRYVVIAMLDAPKGTADTFGLTTAAWTAAPVVSRVVARTGPMLGVIPDDRRDVDVSELTPLLWSPRGTSEPVDQ